MESRNIVMDGAYARANGLPENANPYLRLENIPAGVGAKEWLDKAMAWKHGWKMADASPNMPPLSDV